MEVAYYNSLDQLYPVSPDPLTANSSLTLYPTDTGGSSAPAPVTSTADIYNALVAPTDPSLSTAPAPTGSQVLFSPSPVQPAPVAATDVLQTPTEQAIAPQGVSVPDGFVLTISFVDKATGAPLEVNGKMIDIATGTVLSEVDNSSQVNISNTGVPWDQLGLQFYQTGYKKIVTTAQQVMNMPSDSAGNYTLSFDKGVGTTIIFEAGALLLLLLIYQKHKSKVGAFDKKKVIDIGEIALLGIGAILAYRFVKKILDFLGITKSQATISLDDAMSNPKSPWNPQYYLNLLSAGVQWTSGINTATADQWIQDIKDAMGFFGDNESQVMGVLKRCQTQATLSFLSWEYQHNTGEDFLSFLRGRSSFYPWAGLSDDDLYSVQNYILQLPKF